MLRTIEGIIEEDGRARLLEPVAVAPTSRVLVTVLEGRTESPASEIALLSETALAEDWLREEEDEAWQYLQQEPSSWSGSRSRT